jgi:diguanylate cyclase (GGDEF)-like protein
VPGARSDRSASADKQALSDLGQAASDRESEAIAGQAALDQGLAAGGDPSVHEPTQSARADAAGARDETTLSRCESASARFAVADERDRAAAARDEQAVQRDRMAAEREQSAEAEVEDVQLHAARDRAQAAADRALAAADREAAAGERAEARHELEVAATDELTGAWTRRFGLAQIAREIARARRTGDTLVVAFVDVNHLKAVNDHHGHIVGDRLLRLLADTMRAHLRPYDVIVRYGGDEFLCAMPNINTAAAAERMTMIGAALSATATGHSISFGLAQHQPEDRLQKLVDRADADLLAARRPQAS